MSKISENKRVQFSTEEMRWYSGLWLTAVGLCILSVILFCSVKINWMGFKSLRAYVVIDLKKKKKPNNL